MATTGRPSKLTPDLQKQIVNLITAGCYPEVAAGACGISRTTFYEWMQRGLGEHPEREATSELTAFADAISEAVDKSEVRLVLKLAEFENGERPSKRKSQSGQPTKMVKSRISLGQVTAYQWKLSRRFPDRWGQRPAGLSVAATASASNDDEPAGVTIAITYAPESAGGT